MSACVPVLPPMNIMARRMSAAGALAAIAVGISFWAVESIHGHASVKVGLHTTTVQRGTVQATLTGTGTVTPSAAVSVNFTVGGVVSEVDVKTGDQVKAGQTLAKLDDTATKAALASAQAALTSAQEHLVNAQRQATPAVATNDATAAARLQEAAAQSSLDAAVQSDAIDTLKYQNLLNQVRAQLSGDLDRYSNDQAACSAAATTETANGTSCDTALARDRNAVAADNDAVVNAYQQQATGQLNDEQYIQEARNNWLAARDILVSMSAAAGVTPAATSTRVAAAQSQVIGAQAVLAAAQQDEAATVLTAPSDATVTAVNGVVNQTVPGDGTAVTSSGTATGAGSTSLPASSASPAFVTLVNDSKLQVVVGFAAADANRVQVGEPATITLDAQPAQRVSGQVDTIDANSAAVGAVTTRNVAVTLDDPPATLKAGMPATVTVVASVRHNVLVVPNGDVTTTGGTSSVVLVHNGKQILVEVTTGLVGDTSTEITSGLFDGDTIVDTARGRRPPKTG